MMRHRGAFQVWLQLLLIAASVASGSLPTKELHDKHEPVLCMELADSGHQVLGVTSRDGVLAVASERTIGFYATTNGQEPCKQLSSLTLPYAVDRFLELKLLSANALFYCDSRRCSTCRKDEATWSCRLNKVRQEEDGQADGDIVGAVSTLGGDHIFARITFESGKASVYTFKLDDDSLLVDASGHKEDQRWNGKNTDIPFMKNHKLATAFTEGGYSYFVSSSTHPNEPFARLKSTQNDRLPIPNVSMVRVARMCNGDKTDTLESRIDLVLTCSSSFGSKDNVSVASAMYDSSTQKLFVGFASETKGAVCTFELHNINRAMEETWNICQNESILNFGKCDYPKDPKNLEPSCYIFTRNTGDGRSELCSMYTAEKGAYDVCRLDLVPQMKYRYSMLDNYKGLSGKVISRVDSPHRDYTQMSFDRISKAMFMASDDMLERWPADILGFKDSIEAGLPSLHKFIEPPKRFSFSRNVDDTSILIAEKNAVKRYKISCSGLYTSKEGDCKEMAYGFNDPLGCAWCPKSTGKGDVLPISEKNSCPTTALISKCPPIIFKHSPLGNRRWELEGTQFDSLANSRILICNQICQPIFNNSESITCELGSGMVYDRECKSVKMYGEFEGTKNYEVIPTHGSYLESGSQTDLARSGGSDGGVTWKVIVGVVAFIAIIGIIVLIILLGKKYRLIPRLMPSDRKNDGSIGVPFDTLTSYPRNNIPHRNTYVPNGPEETRFPLSREYDRNYERLFRNIDSRLIVKEENIKLEKQIGKGNFGIVLKGTMVDDDGNETAVACKTIPGYGENSASIAEFINEGLMMDRFDHPRVMKLLGIAFTEDKIPIIVTDFMDNGDLAKYLKDEGNRPTLRTLLVFAQQIAEGMAYLHENKFIHRDLATRNCMLDKYMCIKIADFGLCREVTNQEYAPMHPGREMPLRWMPPEALESEQFTLPGDVWAFGVVLWEIMTRGMLPYTDVPTYTILDFIKSGKRLGKPNFCPDVLYDVMLDCWHHDPLDRPTFDVLPERMLECITFLENDSRKLNAEYEQTNSSRNSRAQSSGTTPVTHMAVSHTHSIPPPSSVPPDPTPV